MVALAIKCRCVEKRNWFLYVRVDYYLLRDNCWTASTRNHNIMEPNHINLFGDNEIERLCERVGLKIVKKERFYILMPILRKLIPIKSRFGQWNIYVCEKGVNK
ncbi:MAG: hypothetical protein KAT65_20200 [Methanophagales archaeon]|nr:hypothetical protein [Methanophagales archaeon]